MAKERLSKLQKWIITECFKVNILLDRSGLKELKGAERCYNFKKKEYYNNCNELIVKKRDINNNIVNYCAERNRNCDYFTFYRDDILLSYFNLIPDNWKYPWARKQHFKGSKNNNKAYVSTGRTIINLYEKGYIYIFRYEGMEIYLTDKGKEKALELLNLNKSIIKEPPLLNDKEKETKKLKLEKELKLLTKMINS